MQTPEFAVVCPNLPLYTPTSALTQCALEQVHP